MSRSNLDVRAWAGKTVDADQSGRKSVLPSSRKTRVAAIGGVRAMVETTSSSPPDDGRKR
jgi:hypothetical protein